MKTLPISLAALAVLLALPGTLLAQQPDLAALAKKVDAAYNAHDAAALAAMWVPNGTRQQVPASPGTTGIAHGWPEILAQYQADWSQNGRVEEIGDLTVNGNQVSGRGQYWDDVFTKMGIAPLEYTIVWTFQGDKLQSVVVTTTPESMAKLQAAMSAMPSTGVGDATAPLSQRLILGGLALVILGIAALTTRRTRRA
ncbi:MAG: hypothetical protein U0822_22625 [Anaerolineae bacterium]